MAIQIEKGKSLASLSMTPLIDVVFLLLIFFLVATRFAEEDKEMNIDTPQASEATPQAARSKRIVINITKEGHFIVSKKRFTLAALERRLMQLTTRNNMRQSAEIRADKNVAFKFPIAAANACSKAGIPVNKVVWDVK